MLRFQDFQRMDLTDKHKLEIAGRPQAVSLPSG
jgi:hypothetical protein